mgnify:CR=1 FL=1
MVRRPDIIEPSLANKVVFPEVKAGGSLQKVSLALKIAKLVGFPWATPKYRQIAKIAAVKSAALFIVETLLLLMSEEDENTIARDIGKEKLRWNLSNPRRSKKPC